MPHRQRTRTVAIPAAITTTGVLAVAAVFTLDVVWLVIAVGIGAIVAIWIDTRDRVLEQRVAQFTAPRPSAPAAQPFEEWMDYGEPAPRVVYHRPAPQPSYVVEVETGEVVDELPAPPRMIGAGR